LQSDSPVGTAEFVALFQLQRAVGLTIEGGKGTLEMNSHFQRIDARVNLPSVPNDIKTPLKEVKELEKCGWTAVKTHTESKALSGPSRSEDQGRAQSYDKVCSQCPRQKHCYLDTVFSMA
jgi:hypothetical protein